MVLEPEPTALGPALHPFDRVCIPPYSSHPRSILSGPRPRLPAPSSFTAKIYQSSPERDLPLRAAKQHHIRGADNHADDRIHLTKTRKSGERAKSLQVAVPTYRNPFADHTSGLVGSFRSPLVPSNGSPTLGRSAFAPLPAVPSSADLIPQSEQPTHAKTDTPLADTKNTGPFSARQPFTFASSLSLSRGINATPLPVPSAVILTSPSEFSRKRKPNRLHPIFTRLEISYREPQEGVRSGADEKLTLNACRALANELIPEAVIRKMSAFEIPVRAAGVVDDIQSATLRRPLRRKSAWDQDEDEQAAIKRPRHDQLPGFRSYSLPNSPSAPTRLSKLPSDGRDRPDTSDALRGGDELLRSSLSPATYPLVREVGSHLTIQDVLLGVLQCAKRCCFAARKQIDRLDDQRPGSILQCDLVDIELDENWKTVSLIPKWHFSWVPK